MCYGKSTDGPHRVAWVWEVGGGCIFLSACHMPDPLQQQYSQCTTDSNHTLTKKIKAPEMRMLLSAI